MPRIAILTRTITTADAVSNDVIGMYDVLSKHGYEVRVYADAWTLSEPRIQHALRVGSFLREPDDILIYHYSIGWELGLELLHDLKCRTVIKYHNVTPPHFFERIADAYVHMCEEGRRQLKLIARSDCDLYLADSPYNMDELIAEGAGREKSCVVPPFHHIDRLHAVKPDIDILDKYTDGKVNVLMVGRVSPNKGHVALLEAFATYYYHYNSNARLLIVGIEKEEFKAYSKLLREMAALLCLEDAVVFTGEVPDEALKAYYLVASALMFASEHEGFCVPLVEAMAMKLPVMAYASSAIPGTVEDAGLVWSERDPYLLAESLDLIVKDERVSVALGLKGRRRYEEKFTNERIEAEFLNALGGLL
ncbi:MAG TPA: glycosyltransferase family 4 protein [Pyrinomonadaceae bacterium]